MKSILTALRIFLFFTVLTGIIYPLFITGIAQVLFPSEANGSIIYKDNKAVGSELIGQSFDSVPGYFTSRPTAVAYNPLPSGGSNAGPTSRKLKEQSDQRRQQFLSYNHLEGTQKIPSEMIFASASGLDPHISPEAARLQVDRISLERHFSEEQKARLKTIITNLTEKPQFMFLGESRINVLLLNLETDKIK